MINGRIMTVLNNQPLRKGNLVYRKYFNPSPSKEEFLFESCIVSSICQDDSLCNIRLKDNSIISKCQTYPILLTKEIMKSLGFKRQNFGWFIGDFCLFDHNYNSEKLKLKLNASHIPTPDITYVHELQNLFFVINERELYVPLNFSVSDSSNQ